MHITVKGYLITVKLEIVLLTEKDLFLVVGGSALVHTLNPSGWNSDLTMKVRLVCRRTKPSLKVKSD